MTPVTKRLGWPDGAHGAQPDGRRNFIHTHVGNRRIRRTAKAKARRAAWKAFREAAR
jgi:hypothetical protein